MYFEFFVFHSSVGNHSSPHNQRKEEKKPTTDLLCLFLFGRHVVVAAVRRCPSKRSNAMRLMAMWCFFFFFSSIKLYSQFFNVLPISFGRAVFAGNLAHCHIVLHHIEPIAWANLTGEPNARIEESKKKHNNKTYIPIAFGTMVMGATICVRKTTFSNVSIWSYVSYRETETLFSRVFL